MNFVDLARRLAAEAQLVPVPEVVSAVLAGDSGSWHNGVGLATRIAAAQEAMGQDLTGVLGDLESAWTGAGADGAAVRMQRIRASAVAAGRTFEHNGTELGTAASLYENMKHQLTPMPPRPDLGPGQTSTWWAQDTEAAVNTYNEAAQRNLAIYQSYATQTHSGAANLTSDYGDIGTYDGAPVTLAPDGPAATGSNGPLTPARPSATGDFGNHGTSPFSADGPHSTGDSVGSGGSDSVGPRGPGAPVGAGESVDTSSAGGFGGPGNSGSLGNDGPSRPPGQGAPGNGGFDTGTPNLGGIGGQPGSGEPGTSRLGKPGGPSGSGEAGGANRLGKPGSESGGRYGTGEPGGNGKAGGQAGGRFGKPGTGEPGGRPGGGEPGSNGKSGGETGGRFGRTGSGEPGESGSRYGRPGTGEPGESGSTNRFGRPGSEPGEAGGANRTGRPGEVGPGGRPATEAERVAGRAGAAGAPGAVGPGGRGKKEDDEVHERKFVLDSDVVVSGEGRAVDPVTGYPPVPPTIGA